MSLPFSPRNVVRTLLSNFAVLVLLAFAGLSAGPAQAGTLYILQFTGTFNAGTLSDGTSSGGVGDKIDLTGLPVSITLTFDLGAAPADVFTAGTPNSNSIASTTTPIFVGGTVDMSSAVAQLMALANPADLPVPAILDLLPVPGGSFTTVNQSLTFTQYPGGVASVLGSGGVISQLNDSTQIQFLGWSASVLAGSLNPFLPFGNYALTGYPSFTLDPAASGNTGSAFFGVSSSDLILGGSLDHFIYDYQTSGATITPNTISGYETPEPGTGMIAASALLLICGTVNRRRVWARRRLTT